MVNETTTANDAADHSADGQFHILVVDDNEANRESLSRRLSRRGYAASMAADGKEALQLIGTTRYDLVLLDVMMPGISGLEVLEQVRKVHSPTELPVIMATAKDDSHDIARALELGASDYVVKPLDFVVVLARVRTQLELKRSVDRVRSLEQSLADRNAQLEMANSHLTDIAERTRRELMAAAGVQAAFLPVAAPVVPGLKFAWAFRPCQELAGDSFNIFTINAENVGFYVLDVSGHGVAAALLAVAATRILSVYDDPDSILVHAAAHQKGWLPAAPAEVAGKLNRKLPWNPGSQQFLTLFYVVLNVVTREMQYVSAGHPGAVRVKKNGQTEILQGSGLPIGIGETYEQHACTLHAGERLVLYSDGVTETMNAAGELFGSERLADALRQGAGVNVEESVQRLLGTLDAWRGGGPQADDITVLAVQVEQVE